MSNELLKYLEFVLRGYPTIDERIAERADTKYYSIAVDRSITTLQRQQQAIDHCLANSDSKTDAIINELYFNRKPDLTNVDIIQKLHTSSKILYSSRNKFIEQLAKELGLY